MKIKLILFLDCNKTLLLADKAKGADVMMQLNTELASLSNYKADWDDSGRVQTYRMYTRKLYPSLEQKMNFSCLIRNF